MVLELSLHLKCLKWTVVGSLLLKMTSLSSIVNNVQGARRCEKALGREEEREKMFEDSNKTDKEGPGHFDEVALVLQFLPHCYLMCGWGSRVCCSRWRRWVNCYPRCTEKGFWEDFYFYAMLKLASQPGTQKLSICRQHSPSTGLIKTSLYNFSCQLCELLLMK